MERPRVGISPRSSHSVQPSHFAHLGMGTLVAPAAHCPDLTP